MGDNDALDAILAQYNDGDVQASDDIDIENLLNFNEDELGDDEVGLNFDIPTNDTNNNNHNDATSQILAQTLTEPMIPNDTKPKSMKTVMNNNNNTINNNNNNNNILPPPHKPTIMEDKNPTKPKLSTSLPTVKTELPKTFSEILAETVISDNDNNDIKNDDDDTNQDDMLKKILDESNNIINEGTDDISSPKSSTNHENLININVEDIDTDNDREIKSYNRYKEIDLNEISNPLKREEIRMKQEFELMDISNNIMEPLTKRLKEEEKDKNSNSIVNKKDSFFKLEKLNKLSKTINNFKVEYGKISCIRIHYKFIGIGMSNGNIFIYDHFENLLMTLSSNIDDSNVGRNISVTCMDFSYDGNNIVAGYQNGYIILWDIINKKELKKVKDAHEYCIIFIHFYKKNQLKILSCDIKGIMFTWSFTKFFLSYQTDRSTLFNGKKAGVLYDVSLYINDVPNNEHILNKFGLCAIANSECVFFITLDPTKTLKQNIVHNKYNNCIPIIEWKIELTSNDNPILAIGAGKILQFIEVYVKSVKSLNDNPNNTDLIRIRGIGQIDLNDIIVNVKWMDNTKLIILTKNNNINIVTGNPKKMKLNEIIIPSIEYKYIHHRYFNINCFKNSMELIKTSNNNNKLLLVCYNEFININCVTYNDKITKLMTEGQWIKAFCLTIKFFNDFERGNINTNNKDIKILLNKIDNMVDEFGKYALKSIKDNNQLETFTSIVMDYCVSIKKQNLLFNSVFNKLKDQGGREIFFMHQLPKLDYHYLSIQFSIQ